jgi:hypothetical protein
MHNRPTLNPADFDSRDDYLRACRMGGIDLAYPDEPYVPPAGKGFDAQLLRGYLGHTRREHDRTWNEWGVSHDISGPQFQKLYAATAFAGCLGLTMNVPFVISWGTVGVESDLAVMGAQKDVFERLRKWLEKHEAPFALLWVLERGKKHGLHTHGMMHVPRTLCDDFRDFMGEALVRVVGPLIQTKDTKTLWKKCRRKKPLIGQWIWFRYLCKGINIRLGWHGRGRDSRWLVERASLRARDQGRITVKRIGVSRLLDQASIAAWQALNDLPDLRVREDGADLYDERFETWFHENVGRLIVPAGVRPWRALREQMELARWKIEESQKVAEHIGGWRHSDPSTISVSG